MLAHLADVSTRSLLLALLAALALCILPNRRMAALQHAVWAGVVCGMLALFLFGQALPRLPLRIPYSEAALSAFPPTFADRLIAEGPLAPGTVSPVAAPLKARNTVNWRDVALFVYVAVAFAFFAQFGMGVFLVRRLAATGRPISCAGANRVAESDRISVPVTAGWLRPGILLPPEWRQWSCHKLDAVLAHEGAHVRRRDALVAFVAGVNRSLFWFHPLAWMLERRLALLADQACDESCVALLGDRDRYAHILLEMAAVVDRSRGRLRRHALPMAAASHIRLRIDRILEDGRTFSRGLSPTGWAAVMACGIPVVLGAGSIELSRQAALLQFQMPRWVLPAPPREILPERALPAPESVVRVAQARTASGQAILPQPPAPKFDRISIKPCAAGDGVGHAGRGGGKGRGIPLSDPGELYVNCLSVGELVNHYVEQGAVSLLNNARFTPVDPQRVRGGPAWVYSDLYTIEAITHDPVASGPNAGGSPARRLLNGPMLQALLEDRFHLKTHRETEEIPMFALTVANGGLKLQPMEQGACVAHIPGTPLEASPGQKPFCINHVGWKGPNWTIDGDGQSLERLAGALGGAIMDRPVLDQTGTTALFSYHIRFAHDENTPGVLPQGMNPFTAGPPDTPPAPNLSAVLEQQLGLILAPATGSREFIVIDSAERPSQN